MADLRAGGQASASRSSAMQPSTSSEPAHFSRYAEVMAQMSRVVGVAPDSLRTEAARLSEELATEATRQSGMAAMNLRALSTQLSEAARTGLWQGAKPK